MERREEAEQAFQEGARLAGSLPYSYPQAHNLEHLGLLFGQGGEPDGARRHLEQALAVFQRLGAMKDAERAGRELVALGRSTEARAT